MLKKLIEKATRGNREAITGIGFFEVPSLISTFFGIGRIPFAPGTWGAFAGMFLPFTIAKLGMHALRFYPTLSSSGRILFFLILFVSFQILLLLIGTWASKIYMRKTHLLDPSSIVVDEVLGAVVTMFTGLVTTYLLTYFLPKYLVVNGGNSYNWITLFFPYYVGFFILFRLFDIYKPGPIGWIDRNMKSGLGVMLDDVVAGIFAGLANNLVFVIYYLIFVK